MKNRKNIGMIVAMLMIVGILLTTIGIFAGKPKGFYFSNTGLHIIKQEKHEEKQLNLEEIKEIDIEVENLDIILEEADTYGIEIRTFDEDNTVNWKIENGILKASEEVKDKFRIFMFDFSFLDQEYTPYIKIYLPTEAHLNLVSLYTKDSNIQASNVNTKELKIENKYGSVELETITVDNMNIAMYDGKFYSKNVIANQIVLTSDYGDVNLSQMDSKGLKTQLKDGKLTLNTMKIEEMELKSKYGTIIGEQLDVATTKIEAKDGNINLEGNFTGDTQINSTYGAVNLELEQQKSYYNLDLSTKYGNITLDEEKMKDNKTYTTNQTDGKNLKIVAKDGNIGIKFHP